MVEDECCYEEASELISYKTFVTHMKKLHQKSDLYATKKTKGAPDNALIGKRFN